MRRVSEDAGTDAASPTRSVIAAHVLSSKNPLGKNKAV